MRWRTDLKKAAAMISQELGQSIFTFGRSQGNKVFFILIVRISFLPESHKRFLKLMPFMQILLDSSSRTRKL